MAVFAKNPSKIGSKLNFIAILMGKSCFCRQMWQNNFTNFDCENMFKNTYWHRRKVTIAIEEN